MMFTRSQSRALCSTCRSDLYLLFQRGFGDASIPLKGRRLVRQPLRLKPTTRNFSSQPNRFTAQSTNEPNSDDSIPSSNLSSDEKVLASQAAAIELLEKELGKSLEQAIEEDEISAQTIASYMQNASVAAVSDLSVRSETDPIIQLRDADATPTEIVREARQVHGDVLPEGLLSEEETLLYKRLYGEPARKTEQSQDQSQSIEPSVAGQQNTLISSEGEEIEYESARSSPGRYDEEDNDDLSDKVDSSLDPANARVIEVARALDGSIMEEDEYDEFDAEEDEEYPESDRAHPLTRMGRFKTDPKTVFLPQEAFVHPVDNIMSNYSNKHLKETAERVFGGRGLPDSALTPRTGRSRKQIAIPLDANQNTMGEMEANAFITTVMPPTYASITATLVETRKRLGSTWLNGLLAREGGPRILDAGAGGAAILAWREIVQAHWDSMHTSNKHLNPPPASKSVVLTGSDTLRHRAAKMLENTTFVPRLPDYVHTRSAPTIEDDRPAQQRKQFDVIIASHSLLGFKEDWMRKQQVQNLWSLLSDEGGVLILIEKGVPRGFEAIAGARQMLLERCMAVPEGYTTQFSQNQVQLDDEGMYKKETAMIVAPCTNHEKCPMYTAPGLSRGRKDICSFQQRYIRPPFLQRVLGAKDRNHDDVDFSYLSVMKGDDLRLRKITSWDEVKDPLSAPVSSDPAQLSHMNSSYIEEGREGFEYLEPEFGDAKENADLPESEQLPAFHHMPRIVYQPLKRRGHVSLDVCTPTGQIERWTIPRSFSRQAYRDARKSKWGDLWALGAKTQVTRNLRLGSPEKTLFGKDGEVIEGKGRGRKERLRIKAQQMLEKHEEEKMDELMEQRDLIAALDEELEANAGVPRDNITQTSSSTTQIKPMNNRARKEARKAQREISRTTTSTGAERSPFQQQPQSQNQASDDEGLPTQLEMEHAYAEWQAEFDQASHPGKGKKGGAFSKFGSSSKSAKRDQKNRDKLGGVVRR